MSFFLIAAVCAVAAAAAGVAVERKRGGRAATDSTPPDPPADAPPSASPFAAHGVGVDVGDVVSVEGQERWLSGALALRDGDHLVAALFVAPEGSRYEAVCAFAAPRREMLWLSPVPVTIGSEPPSSIELDGVVMHRRARVPVQVTRHGQGAPDVGERATFAEYEATARASGVVLHAPGAALAWAGRRLDPDEVDRMGKGGP